MHSLTNRERFLRALGAQDIDRVPLFYRAEAPVNRKLLVHTGLSDKTQLLDYFDADATAVTVIRSSEYFGGPADADGCWRDVYGNLYKSVQYGELSSAAVVRPVLGESHDIDDIEKLVRWPGADYVDVEKNVAAAAAARATGRAVYGGAWASLFTLARAFMGEEHFLISTIENPAFVQALVDRMTDFFIACNDVYFRACDGLIDVFYFGSDFGTQTSMFISPNAFRRFFKSGMGRLCAHAKGFGLKVMYHTCGAITPILDDLIDCGVDILDPVQVSAKGMEPDALAPKFKGRIAFHGGISTQTTLPFGSPDQVREQTVHAIETLGPLGLIAAPDQDMIGDIPVENILAMYEAIQNYKP